MSIPRISSGCGLAIVLLATGCGGGGNTPPVTPLSITTTTVSGGKVNAAYSATLAATGGTQPYSWTLSSGSLPAGLNLSSAGVISGTPSSAGSSNFTVQVADSEATAQTASQPLKLAISGGTLAIAPPLPPGGQVGGAYNFQLSATGGVPPYTWSSDTTNPLPPGLSLSSGGAITGTPTAAGSYESDLSVADSANDSVTQKVSIAIAASGALLPDNGYSFLFSGIGPQGAVAINGSFLLANQALVVGSYDENIGGTGAQVNQSFQSASVVAGSDGLSELKLGLAGGGTVTFALAVPPSILTANNDSSVRMIEFDDTTGSGTRGSGVLKIGNGSTTTSSIVNNYAFLLRGVDSSKNPIALAGSFSADGKGTITGLALDENDNGSMSNVGAFTGSYSLTALRGTMQLTWNGNTHQYSFYPVSPGELYLISVDTVSAATPFVSGFVEQQTGAFSTASLKGAGVLELNGLASLGGTLGADVTLGLLTADGAGNVIVAYDEYKGQLLSPQSFTGTYTVAAASGRVAMTSSGAPAVLYLLNTNQALALGGDASASHGLVEPQTGSSFTDTSFTGNYLGGSIALNSAAATHEVESAAPDGKGNITITYNRSGPTGLLSNMTTTGTYVTGSNGRVVVTASDGVTRIFYIVSPTDAALLSAEGGGYLGSVEQ